MKAGSFFVCPMNVSFKKSCDRANNTYKIVCGRSRSMTGPYLDKTGKACWKAETPF